MAFHCNFSVYHNLPEPRTTSDRRMMDDSLCFHIGDHHDGRSHEMNLRVDPDRLLPVEVLLAPLPAWCTLLRVLALTSSGVESHRLRRHLPSAVLPLELERLPACESTVGLQQDDLKGHQQGL